MLSQEYFYHSFPRIMGNESIENNNERGFQIFKNIIKNGLLITPEVMNLPFELEDWQNPVVQHRCCFTLIERSALENHMNKFGSFSIEWNTQILKEIGVFPVIYLPLYSLNTDIHMEMLGAKFLFRMLRYHEFARVCFTNSERGYADALQNSAFHEAAEFQEEMRLFTDMKGWFEGLTNMIYPIEHKKYTDENGYYRQREWKLPGNLKFNNQDITHFPTTEQLQELIEINQEFFTKKITYTGKEFTRAELSLFFKEYKGLHILSYANKIIVPEALIGNVRDVLSEASLYIPIETVN